MQTMGRAARNVSGKIILYADTITNSIKLAMEEVERRREKQLAYNKKHHITPQTIVKPIEDFLEISEEGREKMAQNEAMLKKKKKK
jgi:excinuclease ABC subunit B